MKDSPEKISPLRRRMIEDMRLRKLVTKTQDGYIRAVRHFAGWLGRSPDTASVEDLRRWECLIFCVSEPYLDQEAEYGDQERDSRRVAEG